MVHASSVGSGIPTVFGRIIGQTLRAKATPTTPNIKRMWDTSYSNELGILCQGIVKGTMGPKNRGLKEQVPLRSSALTIFPLINERIFATQEWCVSSALTRMTLT